MKTLFYPGSFDPVTAGHAWVISAGAKLADRLIIGVSTHPEKTSTFTLSQRKQWLETLVQNLPNTQVVAYEGQFTARVAADMGAEAILRGLRHGADFRAERTMRHLNERIAPGLEMVYVMPPEELSEVSSSAVKSLFGHDGWSQIMAPLLPQSVAIDILNAFQK